MIKKRTPPFLIVEVLIAFFLITMTLLPFSSTPYKSFSKELTLLEQMEIEPYFNESFLQALDRLPLLDFDLEDKLIPFGKNQSLLLKRHVHITKTTDPSKKGTLLTIDLTIDGKRAHLTRQKMIYAPLLEDENEV
jgi:hypothetical protein